MELEASRVVEGDVYTLPVVVVVPNPN